MRRFRPNRQVPAQQEENNDKLPDLVSRFTVKPVEIKSLDSDLGRSDAVYMATYQFLQRFSSLESIDSRVLKLFANSDFHFGSRSVTQVVKLFGPLRDPRTVSANDFPFGDDRLSAHLKKFDPNWTKGDDESPVKVRQ